jgi:hypothetical protein
VGIKKKENILFRILRNDEVSYQFSYLAHKLNYLLGSHARLPFHLLVTYPRRFNISTRFKNCVHYIILRKVYLQSLVQGWTYFQKV